jgi:striatin 1/3/4
VTWLPTESTSFVAGYTIPFLTIFDRETGRPTIIRYIQDQAMPVISQTNQIVSVPNANMCISGHEDNHIRFFDLKSLTCVKDLVSHTDSVSALSVHPSGNYVASGSHDGSIRCWDLRTYQCLDEISAHRRKYDEATFAIAHCPSLPLFASGGADSLVKVFETSNS